MYSWYKREADTVVLVCWCHRRAPVYHLYWSTNHRKCVFVIRKWFGRNIAQSTLTNWISASSGYQSKPNQTKSTKSNLHTKCAFTLRKIWQENRTVNPHQLDLCIFRLLNTNCWNFEVGSGEIEGQRINWEWWRKRVKESDISSSYLFYSSIWVSFPSFLFFFPSFSVSFSYSCVSYASIKNLSGLIQVARKLPCLFTYN